MADTTFVPRVTTIVSPWLQATNDRIFKGRSPNFATTTGSANAQVLTLATGSLYIGATDGDTFQFVAGFTNTGATTLQVIQPSGTLVAATLQIAGQACVGGELIAGQTYTVVRLGSTWQLFPNGGFLQDGTGSVVVSPQVRGRLSMYLQDKGGAGDNGTTDNTTAFNNGITDLNALGGGDLIVPPSKTGGKYHVNSTVTLKPNVRIVLQGATIRYTGGDTSCFQFVGVSEAQGLNGAIDGIGTIESSATGSGYGIRLRNFANFRIGSGVILYNFNRAVKADWGYGLLIEKHSVITTNTRGVEVGGDDTLPAGIPAGIRSAPLASNPFMDSVEIHAQFSQNQIDVNDMGSDTSLGCIELSGCTFFEGSAVTSKVGFVRIAGRYGIKHFNNWYEAQQAGRYCVTIATFDYDATSRGAPGGYSGGGNMMLMQGGSTSTKGYVIARLLSGTVGDGDVFDVQNAAGGYGIDYQDTTTANNIGRAVYLTRGGGSYTANVLQATDYNLFLDPTQEARALGTETFVILPNGMIVQWGTVSFGASATPTWTFPKAFPTRCVFAKCDPIQVGVASYASLNTDIISSAITTSVDFRHSSGGAVAVGGACMAIGY